MTNPYLHNPQFNGDPFLWQGNKTGVLLLHGLTSTPAAVRLFAERLHGAGFTVAGPLLPGHGTTPKELNGTGWNELDAVVKLTLDFMDRALDSAVALTPKNMERT